MRYIVEYWREKIKVGPELFKVHERDLSVALMVILTGSLGYGFGRLSKIESSIPPVTITASSSSGIRIMDSAVDPGDELIASKNGTRYYFPWCGGGKSIKEENRIYFKTKEGAERAGFVLAKNCSERP